jgi:ABC-type spermidine/putrescine transport system permease subunit II
MTLECILNEGMNAHGLSLLIVFQMLSVAHLASPCIIMFVLALAHSQIMAVYESSSAHYSQLQAKNKKLVEAAYCSLVNLCVT